MKIELNQKDIEGVIKGAMSDGIQSGVSSWKVRDEIARVSEEAILKVDLPALVGKEFLRIFKKEGAAEQLVKDALTGLSSILKTTMQDAAIETAVNMSYAVRRAGLDKYLNANEEKRLKDEIRKEARERILSK